MKYVVLLLVVSTSLLAQENKPRIFVRAKGTVNTMTHGGSDLLYGSRYDSTVDEHDESIELTKELRARCAGVIITLKEDTADYLVMLNRESKAKRGIFNKNNQVLVANKNGDVIWTKDVRAVASAAKDVCAAVTAQGKAHTKAAPQGASAPPTPVVLSTPVTDPPAPARVEAAPVTPIAVPDPPSAPSPPVPTESDSSVGYLGISGTNWESESLKAVQITDVSDDGSAQLAGLRRGDVITDINGKRVRSVQDLATLLGSMGPGTRVSMGYMTKTYLGWMPKEAIVILAKMD